MPSLKVVFISAAVGAAVGCVGTTWVLTTLVASYGGNILKEALFAEDFDKFTACLNTPSASNTREIGPFEIEVSRNTAFSGPRFLTVRDKRGQTVATIRHEDVGAPSVAITTNGASVRNRIEQCALVFKPRGPAQS